MAPSSADALADTTALAQRAEALGYTRFWVAEHHNMPSIASTNPPVLIAHLAAKTSTIRLARAGSCCPTTRRWWWPSSSPCSRRCTPAGSIWASGARQAPTPARRRRCAARPPRWAPRSSRAILLDLMGLLGDRRSASGMWNRFAATPAPSGTPTIVLLGSSDYSAQLAGKLGLPFAFAHHFDTGGTLMALDLYRQYFEPSAVLDQPYAIVTAAVLAADSEEQAAWFAAPSQLLTFALRNGRPLQFLSPELAASHPDLPLARQAPSNRIPGAVETVVPRLEQLVRATAADEIMIHPFTRTKYRRAHP